MKNDFRGFNRSGETLNISVRPTLLVTAMAQCSVERVCSGPFKKAKDRIYLLGGWGEGLLGSEYQQTYRVESGSLPILDMDRNLKLYKSMQGMLEDKLLRSCHDISEGGMLVTLSECCFAAGLGVDIRIPDRPQEQWGEVFSTNRPGDSWSLLVRKIVKNLKSALELGTTWEK